MPLTHRIARLEDRTLTGFDREGHCRHCHGREKELGGQHVVIDERGSETARLLRLVDRPNPGLIRCRQCGRDLNSYIHIVHDDRLLKASSAGGGGEGGWRYTAAVKPHPRIRKTVTWGGAVVTSLLIAAWAFTERWSIQYHSEYENRVPFALDRRGVHLDVQWGEFPDPIRVSAEPWGCQVVPSTETRRWRWFRSHTRYGGGAAAVECWVAWIPLWPAVSAALMATLVGWILEGRACRQGQANICTHCGYDRAGLVPGTACPECGTPPRA